MPYIKAVKIPDLARATGLSVRQIRRYKSEESIFRFIKSPNYSEEKDRLIYNAKVGVLIERYLNIDLPEDLQPNENDKPLKKLLRLSEVGEKWGKIIDQDLLKSLVS